MAIEVQVVSDSKLAQQDLDKLRGSVDNIGKSINKATDGLKDFAMNLGMAVVSVATLSSLVKMSDTITGINSKIKLATSSQNEFNTAIMANKRIAMDTRTELQDVVSLYSKVAMASKSLGATQTQITTVTSNITKAISLSGAGVQETQSAVLQLGQALASGKLQGDELRAILESAPILAQQIAEGLGKSVSEMRMLGAEGRLTSKEVFDALLKQTSKINAMAGQIGVTFAGAFTNIKNAGTILFDAIVNYKKASAGGAGGSGGKTIADQINDAAVAAAKMGEDFEQTVLNMRVAIWKLVLDTRSGFANISQSVSGAFGNAQNKFVEEAKGTKANLASIFSDFSSFGFKIKFDITKINLEDFITKMEPMRQLVLSWCKTVERAFWWVYDRVIGHSWIPDLVDGVIFWMNKLKGSPLTAARDFTTMVSGMFEKLADKVLGLPFIDKFVKKIKDAKDDIERTKTMHNIRQALGMRDVAGGTYADRNSESGLYNYDTQAFTGRGVWRSKEDRPFLHDLTSSFSAENQIPFIATMTTAFSAGLIAAFSSGSVLKGIAVAITTGVGVGIAGSYNRLIPIGVLIVGGIIAALTGSGMTKAIVTVMSTAFGLMSANLVPDKEINRTMGEVTNSFLKMIHDGIEALFGSGIFGEKGFAGTLALMAKLSLVFAKGREALTSAVKTIATAPMTIVDDSTDRVRLWQANRALKANMKEQGSVTARASAQMLSATKSMQEAYTNLGKAQLKNGYNVGPQGANFFKNSDQAGRVQLLESYGKTAKEAALQVSRAEKFLVAARQNQASVPEDIRKLTEAHEALKKNRDTISDRISESTAKFKAGIITLGAGIGAAFGTMGGFNVGQRIAAQMGDAYSEWAKVGVEISAALVGQGLGAAIGTAAGGGIIKALEVGATLLFSKISIIGAVIGAGIWAAMHWDEIKIWWEGVWPVAKQIMADAWASLKVILEEAWISLKKTLYDVIPDKVKNAVDTLKNGGSIGEARGKLEEGNIGYNAVTTGFTYKSDPFIAGQIDNRKVSPEDRANNLAAVEDIKKAAAFTWDATKDIFTRLGTGAKLIAEDILNLFVGSAHAVESETRKINEIIVEPINRATRGDIVVPSNTELTFNKLVNAIRSRETGGRADANSVVSVDGAVGSMQITKATFMAYAKAGELFVNETDRVNAAIRKLRADFEYYGGDISKTAAAYIGGRGAVTKDGTKGSAPSKDGIIRTDVKDGLGTTPLKYANDVLAKMGKLPSEVDARGRTTEVVGAIKSGYASLKADPMSFIKDLVNKALISSGFKKPEIEGPMPQTREERLKDSLLSTRLSNLSYTDEMLVELNKQLDKIGSRTLSVKDYEAISPDALDTLVKNLDNVITFQEELPHLKGMYADNTTKLIEQLKRKVRDDVSKAIRFDQLEKAPYRHSADATKAGTDYATKVKEDFATGLSALLRGDAVGGPKAIFKQFADNFTEAVIDNLSKGFINSLMKASGMEAGLSGLIRDQFSLGEISGGGGGGFIAGAISSAKGWFDKPITLKDLSSAEPQMSVDPNTRNAVMDNLGIGEMSMAATDASAALAKLTGTSESTSTSFGGLIDSFGVSLKGLGGSLSKLLDGIKEAFSGNSDTAGKVVTAVKGWFGYAEGGPIHGPGTGTSDSIPAMLSNGEFVINAKAAKKHKKLLEQINEGKQSHFAAGGLAYFADGGAVGGAAAGVLAGGATAAPAGAIVGAIGSLNESIGWISSSNDNLGTSVVDFAGVTKDYAISSGKIVGSGFDHVSDSIVNMAQLMNSGFASVGLALAPKPAKFDWIGLALSVASIGFSAYGAFKTPSGGGMPTGGLTAPTGQNALYVPRHADGGPISGPGSATSDSIPAMLSNGEYVINAASTKRYRGLIEAINSGKLPAFAVGGAVGNVANIPVGVAAGREASQQVFNINVTGDVSRQTRREIAQMMPDIASGVNMHNKERGSR